MHSLSSSLSLIGWSFTEKPLFPSSHASCAAPDAAEESPVVDIKLWSPGSPLAAPLPPLSLGLTLHVVGIRLPQHGPHLRDWPKGAYVCGWILRAAWAPGPDVQLYECGFSRLQAEVVVIREGSGLGARAGVQMSPSYHVPALTSEQSDTSNFQCSLPGCYKGVLATVNS